MMLMVLFFAIPTCSRTYATVCELFAPTQRKCLGDTALQRANHGKYKRTFIGWSFFWGDIAAVRNYVSTN